jgi:hypothetical protein
MPRTQSIGVVFALAIVVLAGCRTLPSRPAAVQPLTVSPDVPLARLRAWKQGRAGNLVFVLTDKNTNLPAEASPLTPALVRAFGALQPSGIYFYHGRAFVPGGFVEKGDPDFNISVGGDNLKLLQSRHRNENQSPPDIILLQVSAHLDRDVFRLRKSATFRALGEARSGYVEGDADFELEDSVSILTLTLTALAPTYEATPTSVRIEAEVVKQSQGSRFSLLVLGSGAKLGNEVVLTQGISGAIEVCVVRAVLELCGQVLDVDSKQFLSGAIPPPARHRRSGASAAASVEPAATATSSPPASPPVSSEIDPAPVSGSRAAAAPADAPNELILDYQLRTMDGHLVDTDPPILRSGERFAVAVMASHSGYLYLLVETDAGFALLAPRNGEAAQLTAGTAYTLPRDGSYQVDRRPGAEHLLLVFSSKPLSPLDSIAGTSPSAPAIAPSSIVQSLMRVADLGAVTRTKLDRATRLRWNVSAAQSVVAARLFIDHR